MYFSMNIIIKMCVYKMNKYGVLHFDQFKMFVEEFFFGLLIFEKD